MTAAVRARPPLVAVVHDLGSASPSTIRAAAGRQFELVLVCDRALPHVAATLQQAARYARIVDVTGMDWPQRVDAVCALQPAGVVTFSEYRLADTALLAAELGLPGHDPSVVHTLTDKFAQRRALAKAEVEATPSVLVGADAAAAAAVVGFPAVLKPRSGAGSYNTVRVDSLAELERALAEFPADVEYVLEALLQGDPTVAGTAWGDYVSVESVHTANGSHQVCVTGKFPLAEPFRETGMLLPSTLPKPVIEAVLALEAVAIKAIGVRYGVTHTEIKLTADGPRLIEVNGRLGGYVPEILKRSSGINLVLASLELAVGKPLRLPPARYSGICYQYFLAPPAGTRGTLVSTEGWAELSTLPGVVHVEPRAQPGDYIDTLQGTQSLLGIVYGNAADHDALRQIVGMIESTFQPAFN